jgi:hypothetical protein
MRSGLTKSGSPDMRSKRGRELAQRLNKKTIEENTPKIFFVEDPYNSGVRIGRTDWPGDLFHLITTAEFKVFRHVYENLMNMPLLDKTYDED